MERSVVQGENNKQAGNYSPEQEAQWQEATLNGVENTGWERIWVPVGKGKRNSTKNSSTDSYSRGNWSGLRLKASGVPQDGPPALREQWTQWLGSFLSFQEGLALPLLRKRTAMLGTSAPWKPNAFWWRHSLPGLPFSAMVPAPNL